MIFKIALRNILRRLTRSFLIVLTLVVGVISIMLINSLSEGVMKIFIENAVALELGDVVVQSPDFQKTKLIEQSFYIKNNWRQVLKNNVNIKNVHPRVKAQGMAAIADRSAGVSITGLDPKNEQASHLVFKKIIKGSPLKENDTQGLLIGKALAEKLKLEVGDKVILMAQDFQGAIGSGAFRVRGIFYSGSPDYDKVSVVISLAAAQKLLALDSRVSQLVIRLSDHRLAQNTVDQIKKEIPKMEVLTWQQQMPILTTYRAMMDWMALVYFGLMFLCVGICVVNVFLIAVFERTREFGVLMAIGTAPRQVVTTILCESFILGAVSYGLGILGATLAVHYFQVHPIDLNAFAKGMEAAGFDNILSPVLVPAQYGYALIAVMVTVALGSLLPAWPLLKLKPIEALNKN